MKLNFENYSKITGATNEDWYDERALCDIEGDLFEYGYELYYDYDGDCNTYIIEL